MPRTSIVRTRSAEIHVSNNSDGLAVTFAIAFAVVLGLGLLLLWRSRRPPPAPSVTIVELPKRRAEATTAGKPMRAVKLKPAVEPKRAVKLKPAVEPKRAVEPTRAVEAKPAGDVHAAFETPEDEEATLLYRGAPELPAAPLAAPPLDSPDGLANAIGSRRSESRVKLCYEDEAEEDETTSPLARILVSARGDSDIGKIRRENEDSLLFLPERSLYAVADGMGGYKGGRVASSLAVETLRHAFETESFGEPPSSPRAIPRRGQELASAILQSSAVVSDAARANPELSQMGTTLVAARFSPNKQRVYIGHVGDSRCYRLRGGRLRQLTTDQTMRLIGMRGPGADHLLQAIGVTRDLSIDLIVDKPRPDDVYLLCSDGLCKMVDDEAIERVLLDQSDIEAAVYGLIELANDHGGRDNVSVILIKVIERMARPAPNTGWTKLPAHALAEGGNDEVTLIGSAPPEERTRVMAPPTTKKLGRQR
jgi:serine/threonine protein phosphatase PrpC